MPPTATAEKETTKQPAAVPAAPLEKKPRRLPVIIGIVVVLITAQAAITYLLMPKDSGKTHEATAGKDPSDKAATADGATTTDDETAEVPIGDFNCTNSTAGPGMVVHVDFKLVATCKARSADRLTAQLKKYQARVRQVVNKIVRSSQMGDLNDPSLGTIKRLVRDEMNRMLRESIVNEVIISDMRTIQQ